MKIRRIERNRLELLKLLLVNTQRSGVVVVVGVVRCTQQAN